MTRDARFETETARLIQQIREAQKMQIKCLDELRKICIIYIGILTPDKVVLFVPLSFAGKVYLEHCPTDILTHGRAYSYEFSVFTDLKLGDDFSVLTRISSRSVRSMDFCKVNETEQNVGGSTILMTTSQAKLLEWMNKIRS